MFGSKTRFDGTDFVVDFTSEFQEAPPPDPRLLALHAICARVAHVSGAAEFFDQLQWNADEMEVLTSDGSSASLLDSLLSPISVFEGLLD